MPSAYRNVTVRIAAGGQYTVTDIWRTMVVRSLSQASAGIAWPHGEARQGDIFQGTVVRHAPGDEQIGWTVYNDSATDTLDIVVQVSTSDLDDTRQVQVRPTQYVPIADAAVGVAAALLIPAKIGRQRVHFRGADANGGTIHLGNSTITTTSGMRIKAGEPGSFEGSGPVYGVATAAAQTLDGIVEEVE